MAIAEELALTDGVSGPAKKMAAAIGGVERATVDAAASLAKMSRATGAVSMPAIKPPKVPAPPKALASSWTKVGKEAGNAGLAVAGVGGPLGKAAAMAGPVGLIAVGVGAIGIAAAAAALKMGELVVDIIAAAAAASVLRGKGVALFDSLSGGRGDVVMERLKTQAIATGQSFEDLQERTKKARDAGLSFGDAFQLNLLRGDLLAAERSAAEADAAIDGVVAAVKAGGNASKEIAKVADQFNVVGDGAAAATKTSKTLGGVLGRLKAVPANLFDAIGKQLAPDFDKAAESVGKWLDEMNKSGTVQAVVDGVVGAIRGIGRVITAVAPIAKALWEGLKTGLSGLGPLFKIISAAIGSVGGKSGEASGFMTSLAMAAKVLGIGIGIVIGAFVLMGTAIGAAVAAGAAIIGFFAKLGAGALAAGQSIITGLVNGIKNGIARAVQAAKDLASAVSGTIKSALKIGSPSKLFAGYGGDVTTGFAEGVTGGVGDARAAVGKLADVTADMPDAVGPAANTNAGGGLAARGAAGGGSGVTVNITVNVTVGAGATEADGQRVGAAAAQALRRELTTILEERALEMAV